MCSAVCNPPYAPKLHSNVVAAFNGDGFSGAVCCRQGRSSKLLTTINALTLWPDIEQSMLQYLHTRHSQCGNLQVCQGPKPEPKTIFRNSRHCNTHRQSVPLCRSSDVATARRQQEKEGNVGTLLIPMQVWGLVCRASVFCGNCALSICAAKRCCV